STARPSEPRSGSLGGCGGTQRSVSPTLYTVPMASERRATGDWAEEMAAAWLEREGYTVLSRNYTCRVGELCLVACRGELLAVVEVRMRSTDRFGDPALTISRTKQRKIVRATLRFLQEHGIALSRRALRF